MGTGSGKGMQMTIHNLLIGNGISFVAAVFTAKSSWAKDTWHIYFYQVVQCLLLALASVFFQSYAGIVSLLACAFRNYLAAIGKLDKKMLLLCLFLVLIPGLVVNNRGSVGYLVIGANVIYTLGIYLTEREFTIKCNMILNLILWMIYEFIIVDIPSFVADAVALVLAVLSVRRTKTEQN